MKYLLKYLQIHVNEISRMLLVELKVLVVRAGIEDWLKKQIDLLPENIEFIVPKEGTDEELIELAEDAEIIIATRLSAEVIKAAKKLVFIQKTGAGVDAFPFEAIPEHVLVANTSGSNPVPMAEGTIAMMFALAKKLVQKHNTFPNREITRGVELRDKNVGIIGLGSIGLAIAKRLLAFEMNILGIKRQPLTKLKEELDLKFLVGPEDLDSVLKESDFVLLTIPLTPATKGIIGEHELKQMKSSAFIVNVGRAALIQEEPLYKALKEGWIAGAGIDVWWHPHWWDPKWKPEKNVPANYPFWELENVILTPHNVGFVERTKYSENSIKIWAENIRRIVNGEEPINQVNKKHQY